MTAAVRLYDSFRKQKVSFEPLEPGAATMYLCGPTTYDSAHIGHAYSAICFDVIRRALVWLGYRVTFVRNVTDVDDKIIKRASERGEQPLDLPPATPTSTTATWPASGSCRPTSSRGSPSTSRTSSRWSNG